MEARGTIPLRHIVCSSAHVPYVRQGLRFCEMSLCAGLRSHAYFGFGTSTFLTLEADVADEGLPGDPLTLKQQREWVVRDSTARTGQAQKRITLTHRLLNRAAFPKRFDVHGLGCCHVRATVNRRGTEVGDFSGLSAPISGLSFLFVPNLQELADAAFTEKTLDYRGLFDR
jgi:hypothetical protein